MTDTPTESRTVRMDWSPNGIESHDGDKECNHKSGCKEQAEWSIKLVNSHGQNGLIRACDDHVEDIWGYHPEASDD